MSKACIGKVFSYYKEFIEAMDPSGEKQEKPLL